MVVMIVVVDQVFWRPIVVWAQRFKMDELAQADPPQSWVLNILEKSKIYGRLHRLAQRLWPKPDIARTVAKRKSPQASEREPDYEAEDAALARL